ncbi:MAG: hypothetical protein JJU02_08000 [Cryomorphaceae bacterium]|nr:hypothetical protein [Cryomorphaceae bacterium]
MEIEKSANNLYHEILQLVEEARSFVANTSNKTITLLYWRIGERINKDLLDNKRAEYGKQIVSQLATQLQTQFGQRGFQQRNIRRMMQFAELFPDLKIVSELATQLSWSHFIELFTIKDHLQREFYTQMALYEKWGTKQLRAKIDGMLYERTHQRSNRNLKAFIDRTRWGNAE